MRLQDAQAIVDSRQIVACNYGNSDDHCAFIEIELGETAYSVWPGMGRKATTHDTWPEVVEALAWLGDRDDWAQMTEDQDEG